MQKTERPKLSLVASTTQKLYFSRITYFFILKTRKRRRYTAGIYIRTFNLLDETLSTYQKRRLRFLSSIGSWFLIHVAPARAYALPRNRAHSSPLLTKHLNDKLLHDEHTHLHAIPSQHSNKLSHRSQHAPSDTHSQFTGALMTKAKPQADETS